MAGADDDPREPGDIETDPTDPSDPLRGEPEKFIGGSAIYTACGAAPPSSSPVAAFALLLALVAARRQRR